MLVKNPLSRLTKMSHIKAHPCLRNFSWDSLISLDLEPPFVPKLNSKEDDFNTVPYVSYLKVIQMILILLFFPFHNSKQKFNLLLKKNQKEYIPTKEVKIDKNNQEKYDIWFKEF